MKDKLKQASWMSFLYGALFDLNNDDFIERLEEVLQEEDIISVLGSADEKTKKLFTKPYDIDEIKEYLKAQNEVFEKKCAQGDKLFFKALEGFENSDYLKEYFSSEMRLFEPEVDGSSVFMSFFPS